MQLNDMSKLITPMEKACAGAQLRELRQQSLIATRRGDYRRVAQLTSETLRINLKLQNQSNGSLVASELLLTR